MDVYTVVLEMFALVLTYLSSTTDFFSISTDRLCPEVGGS